MMLDVVNLVANMQKVVCARRGRYSQSSFKGVIDCRVG